MNMKRALVSIAGAAVLAFGAGGVVIAQQSGQVPIDVEVGVAPEAALSWQVVETAPFGAVPSRFEAQTTSGAISATVADTRGTEAGWVLSVSGTDFVGDNTGRSFSIENLSITPGPVQVVAGDSDPLPTVTSLTMTSSPQVLMSAAPGTGAGRYSTLITGTLMIPGNTLVDTYTSILTVDLAAAPQN
jgi:hypothetical protein